MSETILEELVKFAEKDHPIGPDGDRSHTAKGERYVTVTSSHDNLPEGASDVPYCDAESAVRWWKVSFSAYEHGKAGWTLCWRRRPTLEEENGLFRVYARLVLVKQEERCLFMAPNPKRSPMELAMLAARGHAVDNLNGTFTVTREWLQNYSRVLLEGDAKICDEVMRENKYTPPFVCADRIRERLSRFDDQ